VHYVEEVDHQNILVEADEVPLGGLRVSCKWQIRVCSSCEPTKLVEGIEVQDHELAESSHETTTGERKATDGTPTGHRKLHQNAERTGANLKHSIYTERAVAEGYFDSRVFGVRADSGHSREFGSVCSETTPIIWRPRRFGPAYVPPLELLQRRRKPGTRREQRRSWRTGRRSDDHIAVALGGPTHADAGAVPQRESGVLNQACSGNQGAARVHMAI
jgi:hypothetical protein